MDNLVLSFSKEDSNKLLELNEFIHHDNELFTYHMQHIKIVKEYALLLNNKLSIGIDARKIEFISFAHDLFKERSLSKDVEYVEWNGIQIPQDTNRYVRVNIDLLEEYGIPMYFNSDIQLHPQAAAIFLIKEFNIKDKEILYPILFHSCPIVPVYQQLDELTKTLVDITMLADKLSSNYLRINSRGIAVRVDLDQLVFGSNGKEFNYHLGLFVARLISQGRSKEQNSLDSTKYYYDRLYATNPLISKNCSLVKLGVSRLWPKRKSSVLMM